MWKKLWKIGKEFIQYNVCNIRQFYLFGIILQRPITLVKSFSLT